MGATSTRVVYSFQKDANHAGPAKVLSSPRKSIFFAKSGPSEVKSRAIFNVRSCFCSVSTTSYVSTCTMSGSDATPSEPWELRLAYETGSSVRHMPSVQSQQSDNLQPQSSPSALSLRPVDQVLPRSMGPPPLPQASLAAATPSSASESEQPTDLDARGAIAAPSSSNGSGASAKRQKTATHNTKLDLDEQRKLCLACLALKDDFPHPRHGRENWWLRVSALFSEGRSKAYGVNACKNAMAFGIA